MSVLVGLLPCFGCFGLCVGLSGLGLLLGSVTLSVGLVLLSLALTLQFIVADDRTDRLLRLALHSFEGALRALFNCGIIVVSHGRLLCLGELGSTRQGHR